MQFKLRQSSKETKREVTFKKPSYKNKKETPNFFNKCKYGILWKLSPDTLVKKCGEHWNSVGGVMEQCWWNSESETVEQ